MKRTHPYLATAALTAAVLATASIGVATTSASATPGTPAAAEAPTQAAGTTVVADGLNHPRGLVALPFGIVVVAESGERGDTPCLPPSPGTSNKAACLSATGAITVAARGHEVRLVDELASNGATDGTAATGPHDLALGRGGLNVLYGYANNPTLRADLGPSAAPLGTLATIDARGRQRIVADLSAYEQANNTGGEPGFAGLWSNPLSMLPDGADTLVSDSGANTINRVTPDGEISVVALLPARQVPAPPPLGLPPGTMIPMESVPTGMARGPDGSVYVGELTGVPFPVGAARVFEIEPGGEATVAATGFTNVIDVDFDRQGRLLVLEHATNGLLSGDPTGALKRVEADGSITTLLGTGLTSPTAIDVAHDGSVYITDNAISVGQGRVLRFVPQ